MRKDIAGSRSDSTAPTWESLEGWVRERTQDLIQKIVEEEVTELLGRGNSEQSEQSEQKEANSEQKEAVDPPSSPTGTPTRMPRTALSART